MPDKAEREAWRAKNAQRLLSQAQVDALPDGSAIEVVWSGGNGPHLYLTESRDGETFAVVAVGKFSYDLLLTFVGTHRSQTQVVLADAT